MEKKKKAGLKAERKMEDLPAEGAAEILAAN
jgi:hypothetical protein